MSTDYATFLASKRTAIQYQGFKPKNLNRHLKDFQGALVDWFCRLGRPGCFTSTGTGKTLMELAFAEQVVRNTGKDVLILCPLAVAQQTLREAEKFEISVDVCLVREQNDVKAGINLINYERLHKIDASRFIAVVPDEASIMKHAGSKTRGQLMDAFHDTPYRMPASATPAPNDYMEIGNQAEFCGWMSSNEMLATFFTHDSGETSKWRLKGHALENGVFWKWMASWAVMMQMPSDLGFSDDGYILPPLRYHEHCIDTGPAAGMLFATEAKTLADERAARRSTLPRRVEIAAELANADHESGDAWIVWCGLNDESKQIAKLIPDAVEVTGSQDIDEKEEKLNAFMQGKHRVLVSKASIAGFGLNMQCCHKMAICGIDHSFESMFQLLRRCWRFGQANPVDAHLIYSAYDLGIRDNLRRKERDFNTMTGSIAEVMRDESRHVIRESEHNKMDYSPAMAMALPKWLGNGKK